MKFHSVLVWKYIPFKTYIFQCTAINENAINQTSAHIDYANMTIIIQFSAWAEGQMGKTEYLGWLRQTQSRETRLDMLVKTRQKQRITKKYNNHGYTILRHNQLKVPSAILTLIVLFCNLKPLREFIAFSASSVRL